MELHPRIRSTFFSCLFISLTGFSQYALAQEDSAVSDNSTVTYPASYFEQYQPFSAADMLSRIPGISVALQDTRADNNSSSSGSSSTDANRRGLGMGGDQILINGRRVTGKENEGTSALSRISASQVDYIEIIRGTSGDLDVRGGNQVINVVLLDTGSLTTTSYELNATHYHDSELEPGGNLSVNGQSGDLNYMLSVELEPNREYRTGFETSILADGRLNDTVERLSTVDSQILTLTSNIGYDFSENDNAHLNAQYTDSDVPKVENRTVTSYLTTPPTTTLAFDDTESENSFWEIGGDYEHTFGNGNRWKTLFIVNEKEDDSLWERFIVDGNDRTKDLYLDNYNLYQEQIVRTSYSMGLNDSQDFEIGIERAQTTLESSLQLGLLTSVGNGNPNFGGLTPITNSNATVEEIRYETFLVHNWQLNERMSLESTLIFENSEISQSGDVSKVRDFDFIRPKVDYRFDITPSMQFRATIEKDVAQLSFNDFTANISSGDDDQNAIAGNPDLRQEQSWRYDANLEYRFDDDNGVISSNIYYHDLEDVIDKVDVSTEFRIQSANGNIGDGKRYGASIDGSLRLSRFKMPDVLVTARARVEDSEVTDPFLGIKRRLNRAGRGSYQLGFRHDVTSRSINYGFDYRRSIQGNMKAYDIDKIEDYYSNDFLTAFLEAQGWGGLTYRFELTNVLEATRCRIRDRYVGGTIATGVLNEIEDSCSHTGIEYGIRIRGTF